MPPLRFSRRLNLLEPLEQLGFAICGWGCMSCIGNSGPLLPAMHDLASSCEFASVLSGNRNFEGRISPDVAQNYLCAPALVVALSLAGTVDIDLEHDPVCEGDAGPVYLADLLPSQDEVDATLARVVTRDAYVRARSEAPKSALGDALPVQAGDVFLWDDASTYVRRPPSWKMPGQVPRVNIHGAKALLSWVTLLQPTTFRLQVPSRPILPPPATSSSMAFVRMRLTRMELGVATTR